MTDREEHPDEMHQQVIHGLTLHVLVDEMSKDRAEELIRSIKKVYRSGSNSQAEAILWQIRKDEGLNAEPSTQIAG